MEEIMTYLAQHVFLFSVLGLVSLFTLVGYFVDQSEQKKGISKINKPKEEERDIHDLAKNAANKSLNNAITDAAKKENGMTSNIITDSQAQGQVDSVGFNVLNK